MVTLISASSLPSEGSGFFIHASDQSFAKSSWTQIHIRPVIHANQDQWLEDIFNWHQKVCAIASEINSDWWYHPASRLVAWHPPVFNPFAQALAIVSALPSIENKASQVYLIGFSSDVLEYVKELRPDLRWAYPPTNETITQRSSLFRSLLSITKIFILSLLTPSTPKRSEKTNLVVFTYLLNLSAFLNGSDHFFGSFFRREHKGQRPIWILHFEEFSLKKRYDAIRQIRALDGNFRVLLPRLSFLQWLTLCMRLTKFHASWTKLTSKMPALKVGAISSKLIAAKFCQTFANQSIAPAVIAGSQISDLLKDISFETFIYPYEKKTIEHALLESLKKKNSNANTIGFAHPFPNRGLLFLKALGNPAPTVIASPGPSVEKWLKNWAQIPAKHLRTIGSPRNISRPTSQNQIPVKKILFVIGQGHEMQMFANFVESDPALFDGFELSIRTYAFAWHAAQGDGLQRIQQAGITAHVLDNMQSLQTQLEDHDVILYCATSAGIEAMFAKRAAVYVNLCPVFKLDPLFDKDFSENLLRAENASELKNALAKLKSSSQSQYDELIHHQHMFAWNIFSPFDERLP